MLGDEGINDSEPSQSIDASMPPARVLIVDDSAKDISINTFVLKVGGHQIRKTQSPQEARAIARDWQPDVILLDIIMPELDGISLAHQLRSDGCDAELMFVTSLTQTATKVRGLAVGDQYLTKPFDPEEMLAMIGALVRRRRRTFSRPRTSHQAEGGLPVFDPESEYVLVPHGRSNHLTRTERALLRALVEARGELVSKEELLWNIWHADDGRFSVIEVYIRRLRKKIELNPDQPELIMTASGGYYYNYNMRD